MTIYAPDDTDRLLEELAAARARRLERATARISAGSSAAATTSPKPRPGTSFSASCSSCSSERTQLAPLLGPPRS